MNYSIGADGSLYIPAVTPLAASRYDYKLGPDDQHIGYVLENLQMQLEMQGEPCYILRRKEGGVTTDDLEVQIQELWTSPEGDERYRALVWDGQGLHPDFRPYIAPGETNVPFVVYRDGEALTRVLDHMDLISSDEFSLYRDRAIRPNRWYIVFGPGHDHTLEVTYRYGTISSEVAEASVGPQEEGVEYFGSKYGWEQLTSPRTYLTGPNQFLVRVPYTMRDQRREQYGILTMFEPKAYMAGQPYIQDRDIIIRPAKLGMRREIFEVKDKTDPIVRSMSDPSQWYRTHQKFSLVLLEPTNITYKIPVLGED